MYLVKTLTECSDFFDSAEVLFHLERLGTIALFFILFDSVNEIEIFLFMTVSVMFFGNTKVH